MAKFKALKTVYLVRHGQSEGNIGDTFQPTDSPLTEKGRRQAEHIAHRIGALEVEALVASPWMRTRQTAEAVALSTGLDVEYSDLFVERTRPSWSAGKPKNDPKALDLEIRWAESLYDPSLRVEDGENFTDITDRADRALKYLTSRNESSIVVVTHGYFLRTLVAAVLQRETLTPQSFKVFQTHIGHENTGLTVLKYGMAEDKPEWSVWIFNDHAHLAEG